LIKLRTATPENKFVTDAAGEIVKINMEEPFIPMNMLNNCMQI
jgi:exoribonuclease R